MTGVVLRPGEPADAVEVAQVQVASWRAAYAGLVPDDVLSTLDVVERVRGWLSLLDRGVRLVVAEHDGAVVGYASSGASRDDDAVAGVGELYALYVRPEHWRAGTGRALHDDAVAAMRREGARVATLWVLAGNRGGRAFYESLGWRPDGVTRTEQLPNGSLDEARYCLPLTTGRTRTSLTVS